MAKLFENVTNPLARKCVVAAWNLCLFPLGKFTKDYLYEASQGGDKGPSQDLLQYRAKIRSALRASGLAQALPAGTELLPLPEDSLPGWVQPLYRIYRPRSYEQLIDHLGDFLPHYLRLTERRMNYSVQLAQRVGRVVLILLACAIQIGARMAFSQQLHGAGVMLGLAVLGVALVLIVLSTAKTGDPLRQVNLAELFLYLREAYADMWEAGPAARLTQAPGRAADRELTGAQPARCE